MLLISSKYWYVLLPFLVVWYVGSRGKYVDVIPSPNAERKRTQETIRGLGFELPVDHCRVFEVLAYEQ